MEISEGKRVSVQSILDEWDKPMTSDFEDPSTPFDWRSKLLQSMRMGDVEGMKAIAAPLAEHKVIDLIANGQDERTQLEAAKLVLSQTGHGPVQRIEHSIQYDKMPVAQLLSVIKSKMTRLREFNPDFNIDKLLPSPLEVKATVIPEEEEDE